MKKTKYISLIGYACGLGAGQMLCSQGPAKAKQSHLIKQADFHWETILGTDNLEQQLSKLDIIARLSNKLAQITQSLIREKKFFITIGGDHSCAIGTWSGVAAAIAPNPLGLIWVDAHLDSHTPQTSPSGNIHGMPLAALLGHGEPCLTQISTPLAKVEAKNVYIIGVRSYEEGEQMLLNRLGVRIYYMDEIKQRGLDQIMLEVITSLKKSVKHYGISLDLDAISPEEAPGVGCPEPEGLSADSVYKSLISVAQDSRCIAAEIAEFSPPLDQEEKTEHILANLLQLFSNGLSKRCENE